MSTQVQLRRGTSTECDAFTGVVGEAFYDTTNKRLRMSDGSTAGGTALAKLSDVGVADGDYGDIVVSSSGTVMSIDSNVLTSAGRALIDDSDATAQRATLNISGKRKIWVPARAMDPRVTNGPSVGVSEMATNKNNYTSLDFDTTTQEFAQFTVCFGNSWDKGTVTFQPVWSHASTSTNFGVVWALQAVALSDTDAMDVAFGTEQTSTDTGGTTNTRYIGPESSAITIAGSPANGDQILFQIKRNPSDGSDTMAIDARLNGLWIYFTDTGANDA